MTNKEISGLIKLTGQLMELHGENKFKTKSYSNASFQIGKNPKPLDSLSVPELEGTFGLGKSIAAKVFEMTTTGKLEVLEEHINKTPKGVLDILSVKGVGASKVRVLWKDMEIESLGELLQLCEENRLVEVKGFGAKTQESIKQNIQYRISSEGKFHYASAENMALQLVNQLRNQFPDAQVELTGEIRRKCEIIEQINILISSENTIDIPEIETNIPIVFHHCKPNEFGSVQLRITGSESHVNSLNIPDGISTEEEVYKQNGMPYIEPELREGLSEIEWAKTNSLPELVKDSDLKGIVHNHSTYSDGRNTLEEMAVACRDLGMEYFGIADHSKTAVYANGLYPEDVLKQHQEIDELNKKLAPFKILKGIESDILYDGSLDYEEDILRKFDYVVASVHSQLKMDEEKANARLITAIENPYTTILGHPTSRLLLSRKGYPINHKKIIDACSANNVVIEINANPLRLDLDWRHIQYALEKNVMLSINPDAHNIDGFTHMHYGTCVARKGGLNKEMTFNALSLKEMEIYLNKG
ncbi:MAG: DNA polymerase/3'-5' exonuclease PolX [Flavobacteriales bacterium]|nr:DNA polymerase/3'-5' exonuclease PolX [Flavobacteriales bacterium]